MRFSHRAGGIAGVTELIVPRLFLNGHAIAGNAALIALQTCDAAWEFLAVLAAWRVAKGLVKVAVRQKATNLIDAIPLIGRARHDHDILQPGFLQLVRVGGGAELIANRGIVRDKMPIDGSAVELLPSTDFIDVMPARLSGVFIPIAPHHARALELDQPNGRVVADAQIPKRVQGPVGIGVEIQHSPCCSGIGHIRAIDRIAVRRLKGLAWERGEFFFHPVPLGRFLAVIPTLLRVRERGERESHLLTQGDAMRLELLEIPLDLRT